jgi:alkylation response protein AidB-like acyl-CoA dehydrogenase
MDFTFTEEQILLKQSVSDFIKNEYDFATRGKIVESEEGLSRRHWKTFADLDWNSVPFSEEEGGYGGTAVDIMAIMEEFGKGILVEPYFSSVVFAGGFFRKGAHAAQKAAHIPAIIAGKAGSDYLLDGEKIFVLGGHVADKLLVVARTGGEQREQEGISIFHLDADTPGISKTPLRTVDGFKAADIRFDQVRVSADNLIGEEGKGLPLLENVVHEAIVALGAEAVGALEMLYKKTVEYSKIRVQFNQPIGKFQSLRMIMADMFIEYAQVKSMLYMAAMKVDEGEQVAQAIAAFKVQLGKAIRFIGQNAIQIHGGIGMTDELDVGHYFKRVSMINTMFGDDSFHMERYVQLAYP